MMRDPRPGGNVAAVPGHPVTTLLFVAVAAGVVVNSFVAYPAQSMIGSVILLSATAMYFAMNRQE